MKGSADFLAQFMGDRAPFVSAHMIATADKPFDDFAGDSDVSLHCKMLGLH